MKFRENSVKKNLVKILIIILALVLIFQSINIQIVKGIFYSQESANYIIGKNYTSAPRGNFYDRNGVLLTDNKEVFSVFLKLNTNTVNNINKLKESALYLEDEELRFKLDSFDEASNQNFLLYKNVELAKVEKLLNIFDEDNREDLLVESSYIRNYPYAEEYAHIIGYTNLASEADVKSGLSMEDYVGAYKLERQWDESLQGKKGEELVLDNTLIEVPPLAGGSVELTIDNNWQNVLYNLFREYDNRYKSIGAAGGGGTIIDVESGEIMAMVSYPGFDTNEITIGISQEEYNSLLTVREKPLVDKVIGSAASPGSTFKLVTSYSLLENNIIDPPTTYYSDRCISLSSTTQFCEFGKNFYGQMDLNRALYVSSNLYFCNFIQQLEDSKSIEAFVKNANQLGIGEDFAIDLEGSVSGNMDSPQYKREVEGIEWFTGDSCNAVIGQGAVLVTPMHMALVVAALENNGKIPKPYIVQKVSDYAGQEIYSSSKEIERQVFIKPEDAEAILDGMRSVAENPGSAVSPFLKSLPGSLRAKTGSAETFEFFEEGGYAERTHSWIVGSFEKDGKTYAFTFFQQFGGGGYYIAPMVRDFINSIF